MLVENTFLWNSTSMYINKRTLPVILTSVRASVSGHKTAEVVIINKVLFSPCISASFN